jgi:myo-inositol-1(or 4)-monophosphatase
MDYSEFFSSLKSEIISIFNPLLLSNDFQKFANVQKKKDGSYITDIDNLISELIKKKCKNTKEFQNHNFISEEDLSDSFKYPSIILDPIDGTRELVKGIPECAVSLAIFNSSSIEDKKNISWIMNPFNEFETLSYFPESKSELIRKSTFEKNKQNETLLGFVSRSEWNKNKLFLVNESTISNEKIKTFLFPKGSIAYKLSLLSLGICDFVISYNNKNIWDIAAGTHQCFQKGIFLYLNGIKITSLDKLDYAPKFLWCREEHKDFLENLFLK